MQGVDKVLVLREGQIEAFGPRQEVLARVMGPRAAPPVQGPRPPEASKPGVAA